MTTYVNMVEDGSGDIVDIEYFCSGSCFAISTGKPSYGHAWPGGSETDYDVHCTHCEALLWRGLQTDEELADEGILNSWLGDDDAA